MDDIKKMRLLMEQSKVIEIREHEIWEFIRLTPQQTGLQYDIYVDNGGAYIHYHHKLWLYVDVGSEKFPVTIEKNPSLVLFVRDNKFNYCEIYNFIKYNYKLLKNLADGKTDDIMFFRLLKKINECVQNGLLIEMATLRSDKSKLPTTIWVDENRLYEPHSPRIKFRANFQNKDTRLDPSMEIENPDNIHHLPKSNNLTSSQINHIKQFVIANKELLLSLCKKEINYEEFLNSMKIVDEDGKVINKEEIEIGDFVNGFAKCEKNEKFNYVDENGRYMFEDFIFDSASDFIPYINGILLAYVSIGEEYFYINTKGKRVNI